MRPVLFLVLSLLIVAGVVAGPGYFFYCRNFSGSQIIEFEVFDKGTRHTSGGNTSDSRVYSETSIFTPVKLDPGMNPIGFNIVYKFARFKRGATGKASGARYVVEMGLGEKEIWREEIQRRRKQSAKKKKKGKKKLIQPDELMGKRRSEQIKVFSVAEEGEYVITVTESGNERVMEELSVELRRNVLVPKLIVVICGFVVLVVSAVGMGVLCKKKRAVA